MDRLGDQKRDHTKGGSMKCNMDWSSIPVLLAILGVLGLLYGFYSITYDVEEEELPELTAVPIQVVDKIESPLVIDQSLPVIEVEQLKAPVLSDEDIMAIVIMCEAGNQEMIGKVAVAATILNRCDYYGETVETVVYKPNQFSFDPDTVPSEECYQAVKIALRERNLFPDTMLWFSSDGYPNYGKPYLKIQGHYFCCAEKEGLPV